MNKNWKLGIGNWKFIKGFTLIELLVVITVIGLLSAMVLVGLSGVRAQGRDTRRIADLRNTQNALEIYFNKENTYPGQTDWISLETELVSADIGVKRLPRDPLNRSSYQYEYRSSGNGLHYVLKATLESGDSSALRDDVDGTVYGLGCDDPGYCIEL
ncbi:MAG: prepilin-type N-terminal cleavage/methylation domain-containing protein [Patescibacteria group bacterium]